MLSDTLQAKLQTTDKVCFFGFPFEGKLSAPRLTDEVETTALSKKAKYSLSFCHLIHHR